MNPKHLWYIIPVCLIFGILLGFYAAIPEKIIIDTGDNMKELSLVMNNISSNYNAACHNLTFKCNCDTYDMTEVNKKFSMIQTYQLADWKERCDNVAILSYACMNRHMFEDLDFTCDSLYELWGKNLT